MNFFRMVVRNGQVFKMKCQHMGYWTDMAAKTLHWYVPVYAKPLFTGTEAECRKFIAKSGAEYVVEKEDE